MNETMLNTMAAGFVGGMAILGIVSVIGFFMDTLLEWRTAKRKTNTDVPELQNTLRELKRKVSYMESDVKRLERSRRHDGTNGQALLDEPQQEASAL